MRYMRSLPPSLSTVQLKTSCSQELSVKVPINQYLSMLHRHCVKQEGKRSDRNKVQGVQKPRKKLIGKEAIQVQNSWKVERTFLILLLSERHFHLRGFVSPSPAFSGSVIQLYQATGANAKYVINPRSQQYSSTNVLCLFLDYLRTYIYIKRYLINKRLLLRLILSSLILLPKTWNWRTHQNRSRRHGEANSYRCTERHQLTYQ